MQSSCQLQTLLIGSLSSVIAIMASTAWALSITTAPVGNPGRVRCPSSAQAIGE